MRKVRGAVLAGVIAVAAIGTAVVAANHEGRVMKVAMPDGSVARIEYFGDIAPKVTVAPAGALMPVAMFEPEDLAPFAAFDKIAAQMDRDFEAMIQQAAALQARPFTYDGKLDMAAFGKLPAGTMHYSFVSTTTGNGTCSRSVEMTSVGANQQPKVVQTSSGDCKGMPNLTPATAAPAAEPVKVQPVKAEAKPRAAAPSTI